MKFLFVSNYINHHQIPLCEAIMRIIGDENFIFVQTQPMEEERVRMGWGVDMSSLTYLKIYDNDKIFTLNAINDFDVVMLGWTENDEVREACLKRADSGKLLLRMSERIYREGQWKAISPKGLISKYKEHIRFRNKKVYMLCNGAYVASDFALIGAYPNKKFRWGYFPEYREYTKEQMRNMKRMEDNKTPRILWAGRFMDGVKHPEFALELAAYLKEKNYSFHIDVVGDGEMGDDLHYYVDENRLTDVVTFHGFLPPSRVRQMMEEAHIYLFTSNNLEGWGAVVNEAMNAGCAVVAGSMAGAVPYLIKDGENGYIYNAEDLQSFLRKAEDLVRHPSKQQKFGNNAYNTITSLWNSNIAARRLIDFCTAMLKDKEYIVPNDGPMSYAPIIKPYINPEK
ncbi:glycosyltransferase family 4 protein [Butyrivibrio fibrisolvens]|uniref:glycosyltransferase family 4 protein n=1 Tax=Butyrivibrio fibrisolvens TaxID=831 RepID=UPI00041E42D0|nr:glycosyltransferase family 4 protein [Butyrivibrio fibrisolvens]